MAPSGGNRQEDWLDGDILPWLAVGTLVGTQEKMSRTMTDQDPSACICEIVRIWLEVTVSAFEDPTCK